MLSECLRSVCFGSSQFVPLGMAIAASSALVSPTALLPSFPSCCFPFPLLTSPPITASHYQTCNASPFTYTSSYYQIYDTLPFTIGNENSFTQIIVTVQNNWQHTHCAILTGIRAAESHRGPLGNNSNWGPKQISLEVSLVLFNGVYPQFSVACEFQFLKTYTVNDQYHSFIVCLLVGTTTVFLPY